MPVRRRCPIGFDAPTYYDTQDWAAWTKTADELQDMGASGIRCGVVPWKTSDAQLAFMERVLKDCVRRGLTVSFTTAQLPNLGQDSLEVAISKATAYIKKLAKYVAPHVTFWQVLNEHDSGSWRDYSTMFGSVYDGATNQHRRRPGMTDEYLVGLRDVLASCAREIKAVNPGVLVGTAVTGVQVDEWCEICIWYPFYDIVGPAVDFIGINGYLMTWGKYYREAPGRLRRVAQRYGKPIVMTEFGIPTAADRSTDEEMMELVAHQIHAVTASTDVAGAYIYQWRDRTDVTGAEALFGVKRSDDTFKNGARAVRFVLRNYDGRVMTDG